MQCKILLVFDFDETVSQENTCMTVYKLIGEGRKEIWNGIQPGAWHMFMHKVFARLQDDNWSLPQIREALEEVPLVDGMQELFEHIRENKHWYDCVLISNATTFIIDSIIDKYELRPAIDRIYTNPTVYVNGILGVEACHSHSHEICPPNMCKGSLLTEFIQEQKDEHVLYKMVCYCGDGGNDFCPSLQLKSTDFVFARRGFSLAKRIAHHFESGETIDARVALWDDGYQVLHIIGIECGKVIRSIIEAKRKEETSKANETGKTDESDTIRNKDRTSRNSSASRSSKAGKTDETGKSDQTNESDKTTSIDRTSRNSSASRSSKAGKTDETGKSDQTNESDKTTSIDRTSRNSSASRSSKAGKTDQINESDKTSNKGRTSRNSSASRSSRASRSEKISKTDEYGEADKPRTTDECMEIQKTESSEEVFLLAPTN